MLKSAIYLSIEKELKDRLAEEAGRQHRSLANMLEWILIQYFKRGPAWGPVRPSK